MAGSTTQRTASQVTKAQVTAAPVNATAAPQRATRPRTPQVPDPDLTKQAIDENARRLASDAEAEVAAAMTGLVAQETRQKVRDADIARAQ
ncbi:MAG: hypothetical protein PUF51_00155, partial [Bifidobacteriaceae bacterium]|nr:hypothetical protein [Bifidobacteriaceae bacterium]